MIQRYKIHIFMFGPAILMLLILAMYFVIGFMHPAATRPTKVPAYTITLSSNKTAQDAPQSTLPTQPVVSSSPAVKAAPAQPAKPTQTNTAAPATQPITVPSPVPTPTPASSGCPAGQVALDPNGVACTSLCHYAQLQAIQAEKDYWANRNDTTTYVNEAGNYNQLAAQADAAGNCNDKPLPMPPFTNGLYPPTPQPGV